ncbi:hypothetical protein GCM10010300_11550 [Streptomyces olivaceoviridis]|nr:hypothetical protein GCM10010300_11550 [Streptomyces olivaceoviridis]
MRADQAGTASVTVPADWDSGRRRLLRTEKGRLITLVSAFVSGYAGFSTGFAGSPPFFSQRSSLAMASEKEWATVA